MESSRGFSPSANAGGVALHFDGTSLKRVVSERPDGGAYLVEPAPGGGVRESHLDVSCLDAPASPGGSGCAGSPSRRARGELASEPVAA